MRNGMGNFKDRLRRVTPYVPGEQPDRADMIKLNTNENPYPPAPGVQEIMNHMETDALRLYPKPDARELAEAIAREYGVEREQVFLGAGSDDVLGMAFLTCFAGGKDAGREQAILFPDITYSFYPVWAELFGIPYRCKALKEDFHIRKEDYLEPNGGIVLANPNAPTSVAEELSTLEEIVQKNQDSVVIIDEAYVDFGADSAVSLVERYENLLVVQTFSKSRSMAGMRIGFAIGSKTLIAAMQAVRNSYNSYPMNLPSILGGVAAIEDKAYFERTRRAIMQTRENTTGRLQELGFFVLPSKTNFLFAAHKTVSAKELYELLREKHIYVRYFSKPRIDNYLRITIGTSEQMERLLQVLSEYLT